MRLWGFLTVPWSPRACVQVDQPSEEASPLSCLALRQSKSATQANTQLLDLPSVKCSKVVDATNQLEPPFRTLHVIDHDRQS